MLEEKKVKIFCFVIDKIVKELSKNNKAGRSYNAFIKEGLSDKDMFELWKLNLIDYDEDKPRKPVWIVWKNIKDQRSEWRLQGIKIPLDCNELKILGTKEYKRLYLQNND